MKMQFIRHGMVLMVVMTMALAFNACKGGSPSTGGEWLPCAGNAQCAEGLVCTDGVCAEAISCAEDPDICEAQSSCVDDVCVQEGATCTSNSECSGSLVCNAGTCETVDCVRNSDCPDDQICRESLCTKTIGCTKDEQCLDGMFCINEICSETGKACEFDDDCPIEGQICDKGACNVPIPGEDPNGEDAECGPKANDATCDEGFTCKDGQCVEKEDTGTAGYTEDCNSDAECKGDLVCYDSGKGKICTRRCENYDDCVDPNADIEMQCSEVESDGETVSQCVPRANTYCKPCARANENDTTADCGAIGVDLCRKQLDEQYFCAPDCSGGKSCPDEAECVKVEGTNFEVCVPQDGASCGLCVDLDGDGYGDPRYPRDDCRYSEPDCDDNNRNVHPYAEYACDGKNTACEPWADYAYTFMDENDELVYNHIDHCGECGKPCAPANADATCETGVCEVIECHDGYTNLPAYVQAEGCTLRCKAGGVPTDNDLPDDLEDSKYNPDVADANCDAIDGHIEQAVFVDEKSKNGLENGSMDAPYKSINAALDSLRGVQSDKNQILISKGTYNESIELMEGIGLFGGYDAAERWSRKAKNIVIIRGGFTTDNGNVVAVRGANITKATHIQNVTIESDDAKQRLQGSLNGASSYGVYCKGCKGLRIAGVTVNAGAGAAGAQGASEGQQQYPKTSDLPSSCKGVNGSSGTHSSSEGGNGGTALTCTVAGAGKGNVGGKGGKNSTSNSAGSAGSSGAVAGSTGGAGGQGGTSSSHEAKTDGKPGSNGAAGTPGSAGERTHHVDGSGFWYGAQGTAGSVGKIGGGGGGGGGGKGQKRSLASNRSGGSGGGGGAGGCPGTGGDGGGAGGASIAIALADSTGAQAKNLSLTTRRGGAGGAGRNGGSVGVGCAGGTGGPAYTRGSTGPGGNGGDGGAGGAGGAGGGGAGGASIGILLSGTNLTGSELSYTLGDSGAGGSSQGNQGNSGDKKNTVLLNGSTILPPLVIGPIDPIPFP